MAGELKRSALQRVDWSRESCRGRAIIRSMDNRRLERVPLPRPVVVRSATHGIADSAAVLRDISAVGGFCYTLLPLATGDVVELFVTLVDSLGTLHLSFTGTVVRTEPGVTGNSLGVAVSFSEFKELDESSGTA